MKSRFFPTLYALGMAISIAGCKKVEKKPAIPITSAREAAIRADMPLLPVTKGDFWRYTVHLEIPADAAKPGTQEVDKTIQRSRTYVGKISPGTGYPDTDCFEVTTPDFPTEREFVDIHSDKILLRGSLIMRTEASKPLWYDQSIPFVTAGVNGGDELREFNVGSQTRSRKIQVVGREEVTLPAGKFPSIRLLMAGMDGAFELRRTIWFSPGVGIVREEKTRYHSDKLILRETQELLETSLKKR